MTKISKTPLYDEHVSVDDYRDTNEVFGIVSPHVPSDDDDQGVEDAEEDFTGSALDEDDEEAVLLQEIHASAEDLPLDEGDLNILFEEIFEESGVELGRGEATLTPSAVDLGGKTHLGKPLIDPRSLSDAEQNIFGSVLRSSIEPRKGKLNNSLFVRTWNAIASASNHIRAFTTHLFNDFWKSDGDRMRRKLSYKPLKASDVLLAQNLRGPHRGGCTFPELIANIRPPIQRALRDFSQEPTNTAASVAPEHSWANPDEPSQDDGDDPAALDVDFGEAGGGDFIPSPSVHESRSPSAPPTKKRKPRTCKTCGNVLSKTGPTGVRGYTHKWDRSARKFAPCTCPAELYDPAFSAKKKKRKAYMCGSCGHPVHDAAFQSYHIDSLTGRRKPCSFHPPQQSSSSNNT